MSNALTIKSLLPNPVFATVLYVAVEMNNEFSVKHHGRGDFVIGSLSQPPTSTEKAHLMAISEMFSSSGVSCTVSPTIKKNMWQKFLNNCTFNAISAIGTKTDKNTITVESFVLMRESFNVSIFILSLLQGKSNTACCIQYQV